MQKIIGQIAQELNVKPQQVSAAVELLDGGFEADSVFLDEGI